MKTRIGLAVLALLAAGCSESENMSTPEAPVNAKAIRIGQSVQGTTRAAVVEGSLVTATVLMCDGESADWSGFTPKYKNTIENGELKDRANVSTASFTASSNATVALNPPLYYKHESSPSSTKSHLVAVAPDGNLAAAGTIVTMKFMDGQQDVMYAAAVNAGSESSAENSINLAFNHLTTQLSFAMKLTAAATGTGEWSGKTVSVKAISIQNARLPQTVDAANGNATWTDGASALNVPISSNPTLNAVATTVGSPVMIKGGTTVKVDVTVTVGSDDLTFTNVTIKNGSDDLITETAKAHLITLDVKEPETAADATTIKATATVAQWQSGANGSADLD